MPNSPLDINFYYICYLATTQLFPRNQIQLSDVPSFQSVITARNEVCGKVMFLHLSVSHSVTRGHACHPPPATHAPLPCMPPFHTQPPTMYPPPHMPPCHACPPSPPLSGRYASYWNAFLFQKSVQSCQYVANKDKLKDLWLFGITVLFSHKINVNNNRVFPVLY